MSRKVSKSLFKRASLVLGILCPESRDSLLGSILAVSLGLRVYFCLNTNTHKLLIEDTCHFHDTQTLGTRGL